MVFQFIKKYSKDKLNDGHQLLTTAS